MQGENDQRAHKSGSAPRRVPTHAKTTWIDCGSSKAEATVGQAEGDAGRSLRGRHLESNQAARADDSATR